MYFQPPYLLLRDVFSQIRILSLGGELEELEGGFLVYFCFFCFFICYFNKKENNVNKMKGSQMALDL